MPVIYFIRHGETDWNVERRMQGQLEVPINANGKMQAARNGRMLRELIGDPTGFDFVSSPQLRTRMTMEIIRREMGLDPAGYRTDDRLKEINKGAWQSFLWPEIVERFPAEVMAYDRNRWNVTPPGAGAESFAALYARVCEWLTAVDQDTVVVSHGGPMRCIRRYLLDLGEEETHALRVPQDQILCIQGRELSWF